MEWKKWKNIEDKHELIETRKRLNSKIKRKEGRKEGRRGGQ